MLTNCLLDLLIKYDLIFDTFSWSEVDFYLFTDTLVS